jgi:hypothetical protein
MEADVDESGSSTCAAGRAQRRESRALDLRTRTVTLTHRPTDAVVEGSVPHGQYARKEMARLTAALRAALFRELESKFARELRIARQ